MLIQRSILDPIRKIKDFKILWKSEDNGLVAAWETGRRRAENHPEIAAAAKRGELPPSHWKGGLEKSLKGGTKHGPLWYYAEWLGLRGDDLLIETTQKINLTCSRFNTTVTYSPHLKDYGGE